MFTYAFMVAISRRWLLQFGKGLPLFAPRKSVLILGCSLPLLGVLIGPFYPVRTPYSTSTQLVQLVFPPQGISSVPWQGIESYRQDLFTTLSSHEFLQSLLKESVPESKLWTVASVVQDGLTSTARTGTDLVDVTLEIPAGLIPDRSCTSLLDDVVTAAEAKLRNRAEAPFGLIVHEEMSGPNASRTSRITAALRTLGFTVGGTISFFLFLFAIRPKPVPRPS